MLTYPASSAHPSGAPHQATALRAEGVAVAAGALGELSVDLGVYGWFPRRLPSEEAAGVEMDDDDDDDDDSDASI